MLALCLASSERLYLLREELCTPKLYLPKSSVDDLVKILLCEGGDVELGARTLKHILVFAIDPLSLDFLSLLYCALNHIVHIIYMLGFDCVPHLC